MAAGKSKRGREENGPAAKSTTTATSNDSSDASDDEKRPTRTPSKQNGSSTNGHSNGSASKADRAVLSNGKGIKRETDSSSDDDSDSDSDSDDDMSDDDADEEKTKVKKEQDDSDSDDSDSDIDSDDDDDDEEDEDNDANGVPKRHSTLRPGQHEDESDDEFALMRCDDPYPPMDFQNRSRCERFIKKKATDLKRIFMHKQVRKMRAIRRQFKEEGKAAEVDADENFQRYQATYKLLEKYKVDVLCKLSWDYYWEKNKRVKFPKDVDPPLSPEMKSWLSEGLTHTLMRLAFQQIIRAHLHKLKRQARKIIKAVNRQDRKDAKMTTQMKVDELTGMLAEANKEIGEKLPRQNVDQLKIGQVVEGIVDAVGDFGVFVVFWRGGEEIKGMVHVSELSDRYTADVASHFHVGDKLNPVIINVDPVRHKVSLSMRPTYYLDGAKPKVEHIAANMRQAALQAQQQRHAASTVQQSVGLSSVFLDRLRDTLQLDDAQLSKIKEYYQLANGVKLTKNRMGQKARRRLAEEVLGWQRKLRKNERPLTKKQLKKQKRKEEENMRRGIMPLTEEEKEEKRKFDLAEKKARALRKYDKNKDRNKARKAEERRKREEKERVEREKKVLAKIAEARAAEGGAGRAQDQPASKKRKVVKQEE